MKLAVGGSRYRISPAGVRRLLVTTEKHFRLTEETDSAATSITAAGKAFCSPLASVSVCNMHIRSSFPRVFEDIFQTIAETHDNHCECGHC